MKFQATSGGSSKNFVKLKSGDSVTGVFRGDPYDFKQHWSNQRSSLCTGEACEKCKAGDKPGFRFRINFVTTENGAQVAKIFEQGWTVYDYLRTLNESDYDLEKHTVKITRNGEGTNTTYNIVPLAKGALSAEQEKKIAKVELNKLDSVNEKDSVPHSVDAGDATGEDIPF